MSFWGRFTLRAASFILTLNVTDPAGRTSFAKVLAALIIYDSRTLTRCERQNAGGRNPIALHGQALFSGWTDRFWQGHAALCPICI